MSFEYDVCVVGGCGRVGLPLALAFAESGLKVAIHDISDEAVARVKTGEMPFFEEGAAPLLKETLGKNLQVANDPTQISRSEHVIVIIGTPVDAHLNPQLNSFTKFVKRLADYLRDGQLLVLRSTVYPGTTRHAHRLLKNSGKKIDVSFCPERVAEGKALEEFKTLPQLISGMNQIAVDRARKLFSRLNEQTLVLEPVEAELAKLFTNSWRYIQFAAANQFYMIANQRDVDFYKIYDAMRWNYPRTQGFPKAGFAAGPCLFKDTMQLASFNNNNFFLGHAAMLVNEGLPNFIVSKLKEKHNLSEKNVGILGMAFKGNIDDPRDSLSYKLKKVFHFEAAEVLCTDPYVDDPNLVPLEEVLGRSDILVLGTPHRVYKDLKVPSRVDVVDVWNFLQPTERH